MVTYRQFRNTDPPALVQVWNEALTGRSAAKLRHSSMLEHNVFSKSYFDPEGLIVAEENGVIVGFGHAGFGPNPDEAALNSEHGVICMVAVHPSFRRRGIGTELLNRCETYLQEHGAKEIRAGQSAPNDPFYQRIYGGGELPGFLVSDQTAEPFLTQHGYVLRNESIVLQRTLFEPPKVIDPRFAAFRQRYDIYADAMGARPTWWQNCELATTEPMEFTMQEGEDGKPHASALIIELDGFPWAWNHPAVGILDVQVQPDLRRQGRAKYLMCQILLFLKEQSYHLAEVQMPADDTPALNLFKGLGFEQVDLGRVYLKK